MYACVSKYTRCRRQAQQPLGRPTHRFGSVRARTAGCGGLDAQLALQAADLFVLGVRVAVVPGTHTHALEKGAVGAWHPAGPRSSLAQWLGPGGGGRSGWLPLGGPLGSTACLLRNAGRLASIFAAQLLRLGPTAPGRGPRPLGHGSPGALRSNGVAARMCALATQNLARPLTGSELCRDKFECRMCNPPAQRRRLAPRAHDSRTRPAPTRSTTSSPRRL